MKKKNENVKTDAAASDETLNGVEGVVSPENGVSFEPQKASDYAAILAEKDQLLEESNDRVKRLQADFDNFRRRTRQEKEDLSGVVTERIIAEILPVVDNFSRALTSAAPEAGSFATGVEMIYRQLLGVLESLGIETIMAVGESFDPARHEAVMRVEDPGQPDGIVVEELQKGYSLRGKVIRPSLVKVVSNG